MREFRDETPPPSAEDDGSVEPDFGSASVYEERMFKRELFMRLFPERVNDAAFCWRLTQMAWEAKPEDC
jgi:hypothetical protein